MKTVWDKWLRHSAFVYCIFYTVATLVNSVIYLMQGIYEDPSGNWHEIDRAIITLIVVVAYTLVRNLEIKNYFLKSLMIYIPTLLLSFLYVWIVGFRDTLAESAYRDMFMTITIGSVIVTVIGYIVILIKKKK
mgnify:FL=1